MLGHLDLGPGKDCIDFPHGLLLLDLALAPLVLPRNQALLLSTSVPDLTGDQGKRFSRQYHYEVMGLNIMTV